MASSEVTEVLYSEDDHLGIHTTPLDLPVVECVQEVVTADNLSIHNQILSDNGSNHIIYGDELIITSEDVPEEIVGCVSSTTDTIVGGFDELYDENVPTSVEHTLIDVSPTLEITRRINSRPSSTNNISIRQNSISRPASNGRRKPDMFEEIDWKIRSNSQYGNWQQKQVSIKTLEGEFSVTMWASGADEGTSFQPLPKFNFNVINAF